MLQPVDAPARARAVRAPADLQGQRHDPDRARRWHPVAPEAPGPGTCGDTGRERGRSGRAARGRVGGAHLVHHLGIRDRIDRGPHAECPRLLDLGDRDARLARRGLHEGTQGGQLGEFGLPHANPVAVRPAGIRGDHQLGGVGATVGAHGLPPGPDWRARYRDPAGREHARHFSRKVDAERWLVTVESSKMRGDYTDPALVARSLAPSTVKAISLTTGQVFTQAVRDGIIARSPFDGVELPFVRHAFQRVCAAVFEDEARSGGQIFQRPTRSESAAPKGH